MSSLGEIEILVSSTIIGRIRTLRIFADSALFPRLGIDVGVTLYTQEDKPSLLIKPLPADLQLRDASGELRLTENADAVGPVVWSGHRRYVCASSHGSESQIKFTCDLDFWRLDQIERRRAGASPQLWLQIWPILVAGGEILDSDVRPIRMSVPREQWLDFYSRVGGTQYEVLEIRYSPKAAEQFQRALARTRDARAKIAEGEYDQAVALCRNVIEALIKELRPSDASDDPLRALFTIRTDERRAKEYSAIVSRLKQLASFAHHEFGEPITYSREEAAFIVRLTESLLSFVGHLTTSA